MNRKNVATMLAMYKQAIAIATDLFFAARTPRPPRDDVMECADSASGDLLHAVQRLSTLLQRSRTGRRSPRIRWQGQARSPSSFTKASKSCSGTEPGRSPRLKHFGNGVAARRLFAGSRKVRHEKPGTKFTQDRLTPSPPLASVVRSTASPPLELLRPPDPTRRQHPSGQPPSPNWPASGRFAIRGRVGRVDRAQPKGRGVFVLLVSSFLFHRPRPAAAIRSATPGCRGRRRRGRR